LFNPLRGNVIKLYGNFLLPIGLKNKFLCSLWLTKTNPMRNTNIQILNILREYIQKVKEEKLFLENKNHFTVEDSKLNFDRLISLILNLPKKSLSLELVEFFNSIGKCELTCTKSAFTQQRSKLDYNFFASLASKLVEVYYDQNQKNLKRWNGFILCGVDGSTITLINKPDVLNYFGSQVNQYVDIPVARIMGVYDVLNNVSIISNLFPIIIGEQTIVKHWVEAFQADHLFLYDRGFPGYTTMFVHQQQERTIHYVMRSKHTMNAHVKEFVNSKSKDAFLFFEADYKQVQELNKLGYKIKIGTKLKVRAIKVKLKTGEIEILLTNLFDRKVYPIGIFKDLYFKRWGIETNYNAQKNYLQIECFSGTKVNSILQDFYATIFIGNLQSILSNSCLEKIERKTRKRKFKYKMNRNMAIGLMKNKIPRLFLDRDPEKILNEIIELQMKFFEPIRPNRTNLRKRKSLKVSGKYQTICNYKRVL